MMAAYVLDASAVVKHYIQEVGTGWVRNLTAPSSSHLIYLARIRNRAYSNLCGSLP